MLKFGEINQKFLFIKIHYFLYFAGQCPLMVFGSTFARQMGFSAGIVGVMYFVLQLVTVFGRIVLSIIADKFRKQKSLLLTVVFLCSCSVLSLSFLPQRKEQITVLCQPNVMYIESCDQDEYQNVDLVQDSSNVWEECHIRCHGYSFLIRLADFETETTKWTKLHIFHNATSLRLLQEDYCCRGQILELKTDSDDPENSMPNCPQDTSYTCFMHCGEENRHTFQNEMLIETFWILCILYLIFQVTGYVGVVFTETVCYQILGSEVHLYGRQRMFASFGWGIIGVVCGVSSDLFSSSDDVKNYTPMFILAFLVLIADTFLISFIKVEWEKSAIVDFRGFAKVLSSPDSLIFAVWCFMIGFYSAIVWQYSFWFIEDFFKGEEFRWNKSLQGLTTAVNVLLGDAPTFYYFGWILEKLGCINNMSVTLLLCSLRLFLYSVINHPIYVLLVSIFDGLSFGIAYATITLYSNMISDQGLKTTAQATFNCIFDGIGTSCGGLFGGFIYTKYGGVALFRISSGIALLTCLSHVTLRYFLQKQKHTLTPH